MGVLQGLVFLLGLYSLDARQYGPSGSRWLPQSNRIGNPAVLNIRGGAEPLKVVCTLRGKKYVIFLASFEMIVLKNFQK